MLESFPILKSLGKCASKIGKGFQEAETSTPFLTVTKKQTKEKTNSLKSTQLFKCTEQN